MVGCSAANSLSSFFDMELTSEHYRAYVYIEHKRGLTPTAIVAQLQQADTTSTPSAATTYRWCRGFSDGSRTSLSDMERSGRPSTASTTANIVKIKALVEAEPKQSLRMLADATGLSKHSVKRVLEQLGLRKLCSVWIPHHLSDKNKADRVACAQRLISIFDSNTMEDCLRWWTTEDETWVLYDSLPTKEENKAWQLSSCPRQRIVRPKLTNRKTRLLFAFTGDGKSHIRAIDPGTTVNSEVYIDFIHQLGERWRKLRSSPSRLCQLWWQHDNARSHAAKYTQDFVSRRKVNCIAQSAYSPDLNLCDRWIFKEMKRHMRQRRFQTSAEIVEESLRWFKTIPSERFRAELLRLYNHCKLVVSSGGDYIT